VQPRCRRCAGQRKTPRWPLYAAVSTSGRCGIIMRKGIVASLFFVLGQRGIEEQQDPVTSGRKSRSTGNDAVLAALQGRAKKEGCSTSRALYDVMPAHRTAKTQKSEQMLQECESSKSRPFSCCRFRF
jgi:hypothetical protein